MNQIVKDNISGSVFMKHIHLLIIFIVGLLIYSNVLTGEYCGDDYVYFVNNEAIRDISNIKGIWDSYNTRFLVGLSFAINYRLGNLNPVGFHLFNILVHIFVAILVYKFVYITFETPSMKTSPLQIHRKTISMFSALVFLCHPLQTEGVSYVMQRAISMSVVFYLYTMLFYIKFRLENKKTYYVFSLLFMILGCLTKEVIVTVALALTVYEFFFMEKEGKTIKERIYILVPYYFGLVLVILFMKVLKQGAVTQVSNSAAFNLFDWNYVCTEINVLRTYIRLMFIPFNQRFLYNYPIAKGLSEFSTIFSLCFLLIVIGFGIDSYKKDRLLSFSIFWFFITTCLEFTAVSFGARDVIYEHWAYLAVIGFSIFLPVVLLKIIINPDKCKNILIGIVAVMCVLTYQRNKVWQTEIGFWKDGIKKSPKLPHVYFGAGAAHQRKGQYKEAYELYIKTLSVYENDYEKEGDFLKYYEGIHTKIYNNLGIVCFTLGKDKESVSYFLKSIDLDPKDYERYNNLGVVYYKLGEYHNAINAFNMSLRNEKVQPDIHYYAGLSHAAVGDNLQAEKLMKRALDFYIQKNATEKIQEIKRILKEL